VAPIRVNGLKVVSRTSSFQFRKSDLGAPAIAQRLLKVYDERIGDDVDPPIWWARDDAAWLKSQSRKQAMQRWHLPEYWRKHGFPPQCRPIGESDFECR
jgi:hypothetical protein